MSNETVPLSCLQETIWSLESRGLDYRICMNLEGLGIEKIMDLVNVTEEDLLAKEGLSNVRVKAIADALKRYIQWHADPQRAIPGYDVTHRPGPRSMRASCQNKSYLSLPPDLTNFQKKEILSKKYHDCMPRQPHSRIDRTIKHDEI